MKLGLNMQTGLIILVLYMLACGSSSMISTRSMARVQFGCDKSKSGSFKCSAASPMSSRGTSLECRRSIEKNKRGFACSVDVERLQSQRNAMSHDMTNDVRGEDL